MFDDVDIIEIVLILSATVSIGLAISLPVIDDINDHFDKSIKSLQEAQEILRDIIASMKGEKGGKK